MLLSTIFVDSRKAALQSGLANTSVPMGGALAQITHKLGAATDLSAAFARRNAELASARGRA